MTNPSRVVTTALLGVSFLISGLAVPPEAPAQVTQREMRCMSNASKASTRYFNQTLDARQGCTTRQFKGKTSRAADCGAPADSVGDRTTAERLEKAQVRLNRDINKHCTGINFEELGYPGRLCPEPPADQPMTTLDVTECMIGVTDEVVALLLAMETPTFAGTRMTDSDLRCYNAVTSRGRRMTKRELSTRQSCMLDQERGQIFIDDVDCREQMPPYGTGTGNSPTDDSIISSYSNLLSRLPAACATANIADIYDDGDCPDLSQGAFSLIDLQQCIFDSHRLADPPLLEVSFPSDPVCGNGFLESGEECDDGNDSNADSCLNDCTLASCGDGFVCTEGDCTSGPDGGVEPCDDAAADSSGPCLPDCTLASCGDGFMCDDDGCTSGPDGGLEDCDDGEDNSNSARCLPDCADAVCGDGNVCSEIGDDGCTSGPDGGPEACDDEGESVMCNADCSPNFCGDEKVNATAGEECDDGFADNRPDAPCGRSCLLATCGDSNVCSADDCTSGPDNGPEECDPPDGLSCGDDCGGLLCGNGVVDDGEECDDGAANGANARCQSNCMLSTCGDGILCTASNCETGPGGGVEECDEAGNNGDDKTCTGSCGVAACGDGVVCTAPGCTSGPGGGAERCDDGSGNSDSTPNACRTNCMEPVCGDAIVDDQSGEQCDLGVGNGSDKPCTDVCTNATCGDGAVCSVPGCTTGPGGGVEECDEGGNNGDNASCLGSCAAASCGDNLTCDQPGCTSGPDGGLEDCDDGPGNNDGTPDACRTDCMDAGCGDSVIDSGEECDLGEDVSDSGVCTLECLDAICGDSSVCSDAECTTGKDGGPEACDEGGATDECNADCTVAGCGDGIVNGEEECDLGDDNSNSGVCTLECKNAVCGDSRVCTDAGCTSGPDGGVEVCDDGSESATCNIDCSDSVCGDAKVNATAGEQCDLGTGVNAADGPCTVACLDATCGDGMICRQLTCTSGPGGGSEECDLGAGNGGGECSAACGCEEGATVEGCLETQCPGSAELVIFAGVTEVACAGDGDCPVGVCDTSQGLCRTRTDLDSGFTGLAHNSDINDQAVAKGTLSCPGPFDPESDEPCGVCEVTGIDPEPGNCRCNTDNQQVCLNTFSSDFDSCSVGKSCTTQNDCRVCSGATDTPCSNRDECPEGEFCLNGLRLPECVEGQCVGTCNCYFGPPLPLASSSTPACVVNKFAVDVTGTANVDTGSGEVTASLAAQVFLGELTTVPCPYCVGDVTPLDGIRDGVCEFGENAGMTCDADAGNTTFPLPDGEDHSLDCFPEPGKNVSGSGLSIVLKQSTGVQLMESKVECGFPPFSPELCPCGICGSDVSVTCTSNADCDALGKPGPCRLKAALIPRANQCSDSLCSPVRSVCTGDADFDCISNADCAAVGGDCVAIDGKCLAGPTASFCDGAVKTNGEPIVGCNTDADCDATECGMGIGPGLCGTCTLLADRLCFLPDIWAIGEPDPVAPVGATAFCIPETSSPGINNVAGLPGPGRVINQALSTLFCAGEPTAQYMPGTGGCPE